MDFLYLFIWNSFIQDGDLIGQPPIEVFCNFETKSTEVLHDYEFQIKIEHCEEIGCAVYNLSYSAPMDQIQSLIQLSESCSQSLDFGCFLAPLQEEGVNLGFWADRDGKRHTDAKVKFLSKNKVFQSYEFSYRNIWIFAPKIQILTSNKCGEFFLIIGPKIDSCLSV